MNALLSQGALPYGLAVCSTCHQVKIIEAMVRDKSQPSGRHHRCVECDRIHHAQRKKDGRKQRSVAKYRRGNPDIVKAWRKTRALKEKGEIELVACEVCGAATSAGGRPLHGHHSHGYHGLNATKVTALCELHHNEVHVAARRGTELELSLAFPEGLVPPIRNLAEQVRMAAEINAIIAKEAQQRALRLKDWPQHTQLELFILKEASPC
jgi:hypothetical protein